MIPVKEIFDSVYEDYVNSPENGDISFNTFNRMSRLAEIRLMDYMNGDIEDLKPPAPYTSQKLKDYLSDFITPYPKEVVSGKILKPTDYYGFENMFLVGDTGEVDCDTVIDGSLSDNYNTIELVDGAEFAKRSKSYITGLRPSFSKPICKMVGKTFEFNPKDIGGVILEYVRYPKFAKIVSVMDTDQYIPVIDEVASTDYEYGDWARELLIYFIARNFGISTRENAILQSSDVVGKLIRDEK